MNIPTCVIHIPIPIHLTIFMSTYSLEVVSNVSDHVSHLGSMHFICILITLPEGRAQGEGDQKETLERKV
ncbi:hypothetical protein EON63_18625 [archaeon]|nr:MAG: hypothetical protein EON63_18625 [archaeon]